MTLPATDSDYANSDLVMDMHSNARATGVPRRWKPEEDAKLINSFTNSSKTKHGKESKTDREIGLELPC
jgi:hypothetical protein